MSIKFNKLDMSNIKVRSNTSTIVNDRLYYIVKKFPDGKSAKIYAAYDFKTGIIVHWHSNKDELIKLLNERSEAIEDRFKSLGLA